MMLTAIWGLTCSCCCCFDRSRKVWPEDKVEIQKEKSRKKRFVFFVWFWIFFVVGGLDFVGVSFCCEGGKDGAEWSACLVTP